MIVSNQKAPLLYQSNAFCILAVCVLFMCLTLLVRIMLTSGVLLLLFLMYNATYLVYHSYYTCIKEKTFMQANTRGIRTLCS